MSNEQLTIKSNVGWVEVTKPFDEAATERSRSAGTGSSNCRASPTSPENLCWVLLWSKPTYNCW